MVADLAAVRGRGYPFARGLKDPAPGHGVQRGVEDGIELCGEFRVGYPHECLDTAVEVAVHDVGAADPVGVRSPEVEDAGVLQETAEDGAHGDVVAQAGHAGFEG